MSAVVSKKHRGRQPAGSARHSGEDRNPVAGAFNRSADQGRIGDALPTSLPEGWRWATLGDTGRYINGVAFKPSDWVGEGLPIIRIQNLTDPQKPLNRTMREVDPIYRVETGDLLVSWSATLDAFLWDREPGLLNQHIFKVVPDDNVVGKRFLFYLLKMAIEVMVKSEHLHGSTMKHINRGPFLAHQVLIPPLHVQDRIVADIEKQFTRLDAGVAALRRVQANLKRYRATVLKAACEGRLVPTEAELAKAEGRTYETGEQLLARILADRRKNWHVRGKYEEPIAPDTTNLPSLPEGWAWTGGQQLFLWSSGEGLTQQQIRAGSYPVYGGNGISAYHDAFVAEFPTLVIGRVGAQCGNVYLTRGPAWVTDNAIYAKQVPSMPVMKFVELAFARAGLNKRAAGSGQPFVNQRMLNETVIPLPPVAEQTRVVAEVERRLSVIEELESAVATNLQRATCLRQSILGRAFNG